MQNNPRSHILYIDDDWDTCELVSATLPQMRFTFARTFVEGLNFVKRGLFDLYVLDNWLPDGSGIELCREIRRIEANTPVVFLSAAAYSRDHEEAMTAGATAYLDKPADIFRLESILTSLIRQSEARSLDARMAEIIALRDELKERIATVDARMKENAVITLQAIDHLLRARAYAAFIESGGARSHFERLWPGVLSDFAKNEQFARRA